MTESKKKKRKNLYQTVPLHIYLPFLCSRTLMLVSL